MPIATLPASPHAPAARPARIAYRSVGEGPPVLFLHGGWGAGAYPLDGALEALAPSFRVIVPDRTGFGGSTPTPGLVDGFHRAAAGETALLLDALELPEVAVWGHSDGAVIAAWLAIDRPERVRAVVLEAGHFTGHKPGSLEFFRAGLEPEGLPESLQAALARDHGEARWRKVVRAGAEAWLRILERGRAGDADLFGGRLPEVGAPALLLHGDADPRTEPGELARAQAALPAAEVKLLAGVGHAPHCSRRGSVEAIAALSGFLARASGGAGRSPAPDPR
ncbi:alpha/beta fold hydrolase [Anaeromyxobacter paludicola]|uniref:Hydrolase n=1 Tax=Anaeromyxobacter paludicola TaxID=2918171 RepID=A0ABM7XAL2_9BACT|nr:alpha/beta fold hydrolase [Anaeromyxobacter paludicola]BDG08896.1 hydrolase [Anaeromyxobacter paludicola]